MSALFDINSLFVVLLLMICNCSYLREKVEMINPKGAGLSGLLGVFAVIGDRLSLCISVGCIVMAGVTLFFR